MKTLKQPARIFAVIFALTMLAAYVVYSQRQHTGTVMPSSKLRAPIIQPSRDTNRPPSAATNVALETSAMVFPGSKSLAPVIAVRKTSAAPTNRSAMIAPGSKSAAVFDLRQSSPATGWAISSTNEERIPPAALPKSSATVRTNATRNHK